MNTLWRHWALSLLMLGPLASAVSAQTVKVTATPDPVDEEIVLKSGGSSASAGQTQARRMSVSSNATSAEMPAPQVQVKSLVKVREIRVTRTVFDYVYKVELTNSGGALIGVKGVLSAAGDGTTIIDGAIDVGVMAAGQTLQTVGTITLRRDQAKAFQPGALVWMFTSVSTPTVPGILLPGSPSANAEGAIPELDVPRTPNDLATATDPEASTRYHLKQLQAVIARTATVGQVNAALEAVGGRIVWAMERNRVVTIQVPNEGGLAELRLIAAALEASRAFNSVSLYVVPTPASFLQ